MFVIGPSLTLENAKAALEGGIVAINSGQNEIDFSDLKTVDSSAVAVLLEWQRAARDRGAMLQFKKLPAGLQTLLELYGISELLLA